jgi:hypothetical protein
MEYSIKPFTKVIAIDPLTTRVVDLKDSLTSFVDANYCDVRVGASVGVAGYFHAEPILGYAAAGISASSTSFDGSGTGGISSNAAGVCSFRVTRNNTFRQVRIYNGLGDTYYFILNYGVLTPENPLGARTILEKGD